MNGGYDFGYANCDCFWGTEPSSYVRLLCNYLPSFTGLRILDAGCGEGKNAAFLAKRGGRIDAIDVSDLALRNARRCWGRPPGVRWRVADIRSVQLDPHSYDVVLAYGLLHCLPSTAQARIVLAHLQEATRPRGYNVLCAFNDRRQELHAHPPVPLALLAHADYVAAYRAGWELIAESDADLVERHPHNNVEHTHSLTRILARKVS